MITYYLIFTGALWKGIFVLAWGSIVISTVDNVVRPWIVSGKVELHPLVLMFVILGGVQVFGFLGLFLGPVVVSVLAAVFQMLREELTIERRRSGDGFTYWTADGAEIHDPALLKRFASLAVPRRLRGARCGWEASRWRRPRR